MEDFLAGNFSEMINTVIGGLLVVVLGFVAVYLRKASASFAGSSNKLDDNLIPIFDRLAEASETAKTAKATAEKAEVKADEAKATVLLNTPVPK